MPFGWNEVEERAVRFPKEWKDAFNEEADTKQFPLQVRIKNQSELCFKQFNYTFKLIFITCQDNRKLV